MYSTVLKSFFCKPVTQLFFASAATVAVLFAAADYTPGKKFLVSPDYARVNPFAGMTGMSQAQAPSTSPAPGDRYR